MDKNYIFTHLLLQDFTAFRGQPIFNLVHLKWDCQARNEVVFVSLHKHLFQLPSVGYQPMIQECTSSPTWATSPLKLELYKFNSTDNTSSSSCSPLLSHAQMFLMISCDITQYCVQTDCIVLIIIQAPSKHSERNAIWSLLWSMLIESECHYFVSFVRDMGEEKKVFYLYQQMHSWYK
jgi:hypothetical protein